jgi:hypothetical protein
MYSSVFVQYIAEAFSEPSFPKKLKEGSYEIATRRSWRPKVASC